jgi:hypothetical protein
MVDHKCLASWCGLVNKIDWRYILCVLYLITIMTYRILTSYPAAHPLPIRKCSRDMINQRDQSTITDVCGDAVGECYCKSEVPKDWSMATTDFQHRFSCRTLHTYLCTRLFTTALKTKNFQHPDGKTVSWSNFCAKLRNWLTPA